MILTFLGWFYIVTGIIFLFKPEKMRNKFRRISVRKLRKYFFVLALIIGILLIRGTWGIEGFLAKLFLVCGFIAIVKAVWYLKGKTADKVIEWWLSKDVNFFRITAVVQIVVGGLLLSI